MNYDVCIISNDELPAWVPWLFVRRNGHLEFWLRESTAGNYDHLAMALCAAWATYRDISSGDVFSWPESLAAS